ncbi:MAG TPA: addiction module protein [Blastocatellia bacterium]|nr:addiction module protein [Blastocatellia bacterium]
MYVINSVSTRARDHVTPRYREAAARRAILADLARPDPEIDRIWAEEARKRWNAYKAGRLRTASHEEIMSKSKRWEGQA